MLPITGPTIVYKRVSVNRPGSYYSKQYKYKQVKPYNLPMPYIRETRGMLEVSYENAAGIWPQGSDDTWANVNNGRSPYQYTSYLYDGTDPTMAALLNATRSQFTSKIGEAAQNLSGLLEARKTMSMLTQRVTQMARFFRNVKRLDFWSAAEELGLTEAYRLRSKKKSDAYVRRWRAKTFADRSLEFAFGWAPTYNDISTSMDILSRPIPGGIIRARKGISGSWLHGPFYADGQYGNRGYTRKQAKHAYAMRAEIGAEVVVTNPNLYLASQLGLTNVLGAAWEVAPWSFVVDYWFNVSQFLGQWTEYGGITFVNPYHTTFSADTVHHADEYFRYGHIPSWDTTVQYASRKYVETGRRVERKLGIPSVTLTAKLPWRLSAFRAWTSVSLLLQQGFKSYR